MRPFAKAVRHSFGDSYDPQTSPHSHPWNQRAAIPMTCLWQFHGRRPKAVSRRRSILTSTAHIWSLAVFWVMHEQNCWRLSISRETAYPVGMQRMRWPWRFSIPVGRSYITPSVAGIYIYGSGQGELRFPFHHCWHMRASGLGTFDESPDTRCRKTTRWHWDGSIAASQPLIVSSFH
jgi:hypothetical protein